MNHGEIVSFLWGIADLIRDAFRRGRYQDVILPLTVLRRLDCVLAHHKEKVLKRQAELRGKGDQTLVGEAPRGVPPYLTLPASARPGSTASYALIRLRACGVQSRSNAKLNAPDNASVPTSGSS